MASTSYVLTCDVRRFIAAILSYSIADAATENTEEDEEGELADAELVKAEEDEGAMDIDSHPAGQGTRAVLLTT